MQTNTQGKFGIDGIGDFTGWTNGATWNGWETPAFEFAEAEKIVSALNKLEPESARFDPDANAFLTKIQESNDWETWGALQIKTDAGAVLTVYAIGAFAWIWDSVE